MQAWIHYWHYPLANGAATIQPIHCYYFCNLATVFHQFSTAPFSPINLAGNRSFAREPVVDYFLHATSSFCNLTRTKQKLEPLRLARLISSRFHRPTVILQDDDGTRIRIKRFFSIVKEKSDAFFDGCNKSLLSLELIKIKSVWLCSGQ